MAAMRLSTFRKLRPSALEEFMFYDHPSGYERVHAAMTWLKENQGVFAASPLDPAVSPSSVGVRPEPLGENNAF
jgi:STE24 endopeptidase